MWGCIVLSHALLAVCSLMTLLVVLQALGLARQQRALALELRRAAIYKAEITHFADARTRLAALQEITEGAVEGGTELVRTIHHGIASIPFTILESIPVTRDTTRLVRGIHDLTADTVYGAISTVNRVLGNGMRHTLKPAAQAVAHADSLPATSKKQA